MDELLSWTGLVARFAVGGVLLIAGLQKLRNVEGFSVTLQAYTWLPAWTRAPVTRALPVAEIALGAALIAGLLIGLTAPVAAGMLVLFAAAFGFSFGQRGGDCGCFGPGRPSSGIAVAARNLSLAGLAMVAWGAALSGAGSSAGFPLAVAGLALLAVFALSLSGEPTSSPDEGADVQSDQRRRFLRLASGAVAGLTGAAVLGLLRRPQAAEAACLGCGTCGTDYIFLYCTGPCCGAYIVKKWNHCQTYCYECSQTVRIYCSGVPVCC